MIKLTKRKGFNFFRSYYDVFNELDDNDKLAFIEALLDRQFLGVKPENLKGMAKFAWISQTNSIDSQIKGYNDKAQSLGNPTLGGAYGGQTTPAEQLQGKVQGKGEEEVQDVKILENLKNSILQPSENLRFLIEKKKFGKAEINTECVLFLELNYPKGGDFEKINRHFFSYMKKRSPDIDESKIVPDTYPVN